MSNWYPSFLYVTCKLLLDKLPEASWYMQFSFNVCFTDYPGAHRIEVAVSRWHSWLVRVAVLVPITICLETAKAELFIVLGIEASDCRGDISSASCALSHSSSNTFEDKGALGIGSSGFLLFLIRRVVSPTAYDVKCSDWSASSSSVCWNGCSSSVRFRFLCGLSEPTDAGAVDVVIWFKLLVEKLATRLSSFPALIATAIQQWQILFMVHCHCWRTEPCTAVDFHYQQWMIWAWIPHE